MQIGAPAANLNGRAPPGLPLQSQVLPSVSAMLTDSLKDAIRAAYARLKDGLPGFRPRAAQTQMIAAVARALAAEGGVAAIEAPTGTGKSMAYLVAGLAAAQARQKKLLVATATVALQEQLVERDIPQLLALTGQTARVTLAKGMGRYLCVRNLRLAIAGLDQHQSALDLGEEFTGWTQPPKEAERTALEALAAAFESGRWQGDLDQTPVPLGGSLRPMLATTAGGCSGRRCAYFAVCPLIAARRAIGEADLIVANQDLVLADLTLANGEGGFGGVLLPAPEDTLYVFDEAHHLPGKAVERGASEVHLGAALRQLGRLVRQAHAAYAFTDKPRLGRLDLEAAEARLLEFTEALEGLEREIRLLWVPDPTEREPIYRGSLGQLPDAWVAQARLLHRLGGELLRWLTAVRRAVVEMSESGPTRDTLARELGLALERLDRQCRTWRAWSTPDAEGAVPLARWVTLGADQQLVCHASAVSAAALLRAVLWEQAAAVVLTSATLSIGGQFRAFADAVGLPDEAATLSLPSPFDLTAQATLEVPALGALPDDREAHARAVSGWLAERLDWQAGNLVLFTARSKLERVLQLLPLDKLRKVRVQGTLPKAQLLAEHAAAVEAGTGSTLFGLASFGEGLDLPGRLCETVVITQLPFAVPTDPVGATYAEWLETRGRNPFLEVSVPEATRLLVQYCGRLIRSEADRGRIVLLDRRVLTRRYGAGMLRALPPFRRVLEPG